MGDLAEPEPECEVNETKFDDPVVPPADFDDGTDVALPAEPDDVVELQEEAPRPAFGVGPSSFDYNADDMKMVHNNNDDDSDDDENMYRPGDGRRMTRGAPGGFQE